MERQGLRGWRGRDAGAGEAGLGPNHCKPAPLSPFLAMGTTGQDVHPQVTAKEKGRDQLGSLLIETVFPVTFQHRFRLVFFISETSWGNWGIIKSSARVCSSYIPSLLWNKPFSLLLVSGGFFYQYKQDFFFKISIFIVSFWYWQLPNSQVERIIACGRIF